MCTVDVFTQELTLKMLNYAACWGAGFARELGVCRKVTPRKSRLEPFHCCPSVLINAEPYSLNMLRVCSQLSRRV